MSKLPPELSILQGLSRVIGQECPQCGYNNPTDALECEECGAPLPEFDEEEPSLSILQQVGVGGLAMPGVNEDMQKHPLERSEHLALLEDTLEKLYAGELSIDQFRRNVSIVLGVARHGIKSLGNDTMRVRLAKFPPEYKKLVEDSLDCYQEMEEGCICMLQYNGGQDTSAAVDGFEIVENAIVRMDQLHDELINKSMKLDEEEEKKKK